jgi:hypothetical protein
MNISETALGWHLRPNLLPTLDDKLKTPPSVQNYS